MHHGPLGPNPNHDPAANTPNQNARNPSPNLVRATNTQNRTIRDVKSHKMIHRPTHPDHLITHAPPTRPNHPSPGRICVICFLRTACPSTRREYCLSFDRPSTANMVACVSMSPESRAIRNDCR
ncbi:hypothetical protein GCM10023318_50020 [Nocardia callitridis]|uniref:Uncharacterized protein n=1 Tax=Nocardia callitridis TaxID=648753 RepID=A0ABP9KUZ5_9NOCA